MKKQLQTLAVSLLTVGSFGINTLSALAIPDVYVDTIEGSSGQNVEANLQASNITTDTLVATVVGNLQFDIGRQQPQKVNLILAQPFKNFPAGSYLKATINPLEDGNAVLIAEALYNNNQMIKINAESELLYGQTATVSSGSQEAVKRTAVLAPIGGLVGTALGKDVESIIQITAIAGTIGYTTGIFSSQKIQLLNLSAGNPIFFTVKSN